jgi:hypothetical protein
MTTHPTQSAAHPTAPRPTGSPYAPYAVNASPLELAEALATAWRLHATLLAIARAADPGPDRSANEAVAETFRRALLPLDALLAPHRAPPDPPTAARARDRLACLIAQGRRLARALHPAPSTVLRDAA